MNFKLRYKPFSERSILVQWPNKIDPNILQDVLLFKNQLDVFYSKQSVYINNAYSSILINYPYAIDNFNSTFSTLKQQYSDRNLIPKIKPKLWRVPVCYDEKFGIDLNEISYKTGCSKSAIVELHLKPIYTIYFIGFLPGFLYLGGLDKRIAFPRKDKPRAKVNRGSVAIGGNQTGIYPSASPAGWNLIGNCPLNLFDVSNEKPCFALPGDKIQFFKIDLNEHHKIVGSVKNNTYNLKNELLSD